MDQQTVNFLPGGPRDEPIPVFANGPPNGGPDKTFGITILAPPVLRRRWASPRRNVRSSKAKGCPRWS